MKIRHFLAIVASILALVSTAQNIESSDKIQFKEIDCNKMHLDILESKYTETKALYDSIQKIATQKSNNNSEQLEFLQKNYYLNLMDSELMNAYKCIQNTYNEDLVENKIKKMEEVRQSLRIIGKEITN